LLVVAPQEEELEPLVEAFAALGHERHPQSVGRIDVVVFDRLRLVVALGGHGKVQFAVQTQHLLDMLPDVATVVRAGAAGSLRDEVVRGDVVVGTCCIEHDYRLRFVAAPAPTHQADQAAVREIQALFSSPDGRFRVLCGPIASGDEDIVDAVRARELHAQTGALCVAWEGAGAARAAKFSARKFLELRVITDGADEAAASDYRVSLRAVMPNLADVIAAWACQARRPDNGIQSDDASHRR